LCELTGFIAHDTSGNPSFPNIPRGEIGECVENVKAIGFTVESEGDCEGKEVYIALYKEDERDWRIENSERNAPYSLQGNNGNDIFGDRHDNGKYSLFAVVKGFPHTAIMQKFELEDCDGVPGTRFNDRMRSCLDLNGNGVVRDFATDSSDCDYTNLPDGSFQMSCQVTFEEGVNARIPLGDAGSGDDEIVDAQCPEPGSQVIKRDCDDEDVKTWFKNAFIVGDFCDAVPNYHQTLNADEEEGKCTCKEDFNTPPLKGNCGKIEPEPGSEGNSGRTGCSDKRCEAAVCEWDSFCCGDFLCRKVIIVVIAFQ